MAVALGARVNRWLRLTAATLVGAALAVIVAEQAPRHEMPDTWPGAAIRRARDAPERELAYAVDAALTGALLAAGLWLMWLILRGDRRG